MLRRMSAWSVCVLLAGALAGQEPPAAVAAWLESDGTQALLRDRASAALRRADQPGLSWLGQRLRGDDALDEAARKRLRDLATAVLLDFVEEQRHSGLVYRGQYLPLQALQPFAARRLFELLLRTPDWFAETRRVQLAPVLVDLQVDPPEPPVLLGVTDLIENTEIEPEDLRLQLSCLVWQWGRKEYVEARAAKLREASAEGDAEDRILSLRQLADLWYRVHDFARAASTHAAMTSMATASHLTLSPTDWYWGACYLSLCGRVDDGLAALRQCAALQAAPSTDASHRLPRQLFERDPDIARLRADERFKAILERAFATAQEPAKDR